MITQKCPRKEPSTYSSRAQKRLFIHQHCHQLVLILVFVYSSFVWTSGALGLTQVILIAIGKRRFCTWHQTLRRYVIVYLHMCGEMRKDFNVYPYELLQYYTVHTQDVHILLENHVQLKITHHYDSVTRWSLFMVDCFPLAALVRMNRGLLGHIEGHFFGESSCLVCLFPQETLAKFVYISAPSI